MCCNFFLGADYEDELSDVEEGNSVGKLVFVRESRLMELLSRQCLEPHCRQPTTIRKSGKDEGLMWSAKVECVHGHQVTWESSERVSTSGKSTPVLNLLISTWMLLNGSLFLPTKVGIL